MSRFHSWLYIDSINNIWKIYGNDKGDLCYKIMYDDGKWTKERVIDKDVLESCVYVEDETIHILYITSKSNVKYCTMKEKQWLGRTIYQIDHDFYELQNLKVEIIGSDMHIFFLMIDKSNKNQVMLMQCIWNELDTKTEKLHEVVLDYHLDENYVLEVDKKGSLEMLFATYERDEFGLNFSSYKNNSWTLPKRLYCIKGEEIAFEMLVVQQVIHIINKYKENSMYCLDYVCIEKSGNIVESKVHESNVELMEPILIKKENTVYTFWLEENSIFYSFFDGECWNKPILCKNKIDEKIEKYHFYSEYSKNFIDKEVYGAGEIDLRLFLPCQFVMNMNESHIIDDNIVEASELNVPRKKENIQTYKMELIRLKSENRDLNKKIASSNMQLQKTKRTIQEKEEYLSRVLTQKQNADESNNLYLKLQKKLQADLDRTSQLLLVEQNLRTEIENKWKKCEEEITTLNHELSNLRQENEIIKLDKEQLMTEIKAKSNKSFMERFIKRKE